MKITDVRGSVKIKLVSKGYEDQWIELWDDLLVSDMKAVSDYKNKDGVSEWDSSVEMLVKIEKEWSFEDEFTKDNLMRLPNRDLQHILTEMTKVMRSPKKG